MGFRVGDWVEVRSADEILATLDDKGQLDGIPFMPEMLQYCGRRFPVHKRADKTCDPGAPMWRLLKLKNTVHLDLRCDGSAHGGCDAGCLLFWKEEWLKPVAHGEPARPAASQPVIPELLTRATRAGIAPDGEPIFSCQVTQVRKRDTVLSPWNLWQYVRDVSSGNISLMKLFCATVIRLFNTIQKLRGGTQYPYVAGKLKQTPCETLDLQPGEIVEVKTKAEILATLNTKDRNRGLLFDPEMVKFCGRRFRVLRRVNQIVDEKTGRMIKMKGDCIILDGVTCESDYHYLCPRALYPYWREIWLRRPGDTRKGPEVPLPRWEKYLDAFVKWTSRWETPRTSQSACDNCALRATSHPPSA